MKRARRMLHLLLLQCSTLLLLPITIQAYESQMENRGYSSVPYDSIDDQDGEPEGGRMSGRGYNSNPYEVNVDGTDNLFDREGSCSPGTNGLFGSDGGVNQDLGFYYQVETLPILGGRQDARGEILKLLETSISKTLLPSLFLEDCAVTERSRQRAQEPDRRLEEMLGITTLPEDVVLEDGRPRLRFRLHVRRALAYIITSSFCTVECQGEFSNDLNECFVVDGSMTLYSSSAVSESLLDGIRAIIQLAMDEGDFNELDPRLVNVSYREDLETGDADAGTGTTDGSSGSSNSLPAYAWAIIGVGLAIAFAALAAALNKRRQRNHDEELGSFPGQLVDEPMV